MTTLAAGPPLPLAWLIIDVARVRRRLALARAALLQDQDGFEEDEVRIEMMDETDRDEHTGAPFDLRPRPSDSPRQGPGDDGYWFEDVIVDCRGCARCCRKEGAARLKRLLLLQDEARIPIVHDDCWQEEKDRILDTYFRMIVEQADADRSSSPRRRRDSSSGGAAHEPPKFLPDPPGQRCSYKLKGHAQCEERAVYGQPRYNTRGVRPGVCAKHVCSIPNCHNKRRQDESGLKCSKHYRHQ